MPTNKHCHKNMQFPRYEEIDQELPASRVDFLIKYALISLFYLRAGQIPWYVSFYSQ